MDAGNYLVYLIRCILHGEEAEVKPDSITYEELYKMAKKHNIEGMTFTAVEKYLEDDILVKWQAAVNQNILKSILQEEAEKEVVGALTQAGVKVLPLKGCILKHLYPQEDFRQMSDLDMLYEPGKSETVKGIMETLGYTHVVYHKEYMLVYEKPPYISIDMPSVLASGSNEKDYYFNDIWKRVIEDKEHLGRYYMTNEDFAIHMLAHHAKHYLRSGSGIRPVVDVYLFYEKYGEVLDNDYVDNILQDMEILDFKEEMLELSNYWFGKDYNHSSDRKLQEMEYYIYGSGSYGTQENAVKNALSRTEKEDKKQSKIMYCTRRLFKPYKLMCKYYPYLKKCPVMYPLCCLHRLVKMMCNGSGRVMSEIKLVWKVK